MVCVFQGRKKLAKFLIKDGGIFSENRGERGHLGEGKNPIQGGKKEGVYVSPAEGRICSRH